MKLTLISLMAIFFTFIAYPTYSKPVDHEFSNEIFGQYILILQGDCQLSQLTFIRFDSDQYGSWWDDAARRWFPIMSLDAIRVFNTIRTQGCA